MTEIKRWWASTDPKPKPDGNMVFYSDHLAEVERVEMEELDKHADLTEQFANKLAAKDEEIERVRKHEQETAEVAVRRVEKAEQEIKRQHRLRIDAAQAHAKALAKRDEEARKQERERVLKQIDAIEATLHEFYHGGNDEQVEAVQGAITDARAALEDPDA